MKTPKFPGELVSKMNTKKKSKAKKGGHWIQGAIKHPGALHRELGIKSGHKIPAGTLKRAAGKGGKLGARARLAETLKGMKHKKVAKHMKKHEKHEKKDAKHMKHMKKKSDGFSPNMDTHTPNANKKVMCKMCGKKHVKGKHMKKAGKHMKHMKKDGKK